MPKGKLNEITVQAKAVKWLAESYYMSKGDFQTYEYTTEAVVKKQSKLGWGRADGLIALTKKDGSIHTVSIEAKSSRLGRTLTDNPLDDKWFLYALLVGILTAIIVLYAGWNSWTWLGLVLGAIIGFVVGSIIFLTITYSRYLTVYAVEQAKRYPANEKWLVISKDAFNWVGANEKELQDDLDHICRKNGIGLLLMSPGGKTEVRNEPRLISNPKDHADYLAFYTGKKALELRQKLQAKV